MLEYTLSIKDSKTHTFHVSLRVDKPLRTMRFSLPVWIPGSYLVREFSKNLSFLTARQGEKKLEITQLDKCTWEVNAQEGGEPLVLSWEIYAFDASVRTAYLDQHRGFVNGTSAFLRPHGFEGAKARVMLCLDDPTLSHWRYACALPELKGTHEAHKPDGHILAVLEAKNYDELVDSPIEFGDFWQGEFQIAGVVHELVVAGAPSTFDGECLLKDTQKICEEIIRFWGSNAQLPYERYVFMLNAADNNYGGLEHKASTALICKRDDLPRLGECCCAEGKTAEKRLGYQNLLTLICHEFFHTWHVKCMRPAELKHYDYGQENYTELLWFFEGITSYYEYILAYRAGVLTEEQLLHWMGQDLVSMESMPGRFVQSLAQASFDAWIKFYRVDENTLNSTVNYYTKGAMVALCLDLTLRQEGQGSLDDVLRQLWVVSEGGAITETDILTALETVGMRSYAKELNEWVHGKVSLPVERLLQKAGITTTRKPVSIAQKMGVLLQKVGSGIVLKTVLNNSEAQKAGMASGDELLAVNGWRLTDLNQWYMYVNVGETAQVMLSRDAKIMFVEIKLDETVLGVPQLMRDSSSQEQNSLLLLECWPKQ